MMEKIRKGWANPEQVLVYLLRKTVPSSLLEAAWEQQSNWRKETDYYTFSEGGFAGSASNRPEFCARNFYEVSQIQELMDSRNISASRSLEIGAGYGRLSPWIAQYSDEHWGIEPNEEAISHARRQYPDITWKNMRIQDMAVEGGGFDFIFTWTVLQHIPPSSIQESVETILELSSDDAHLLICEETRGESGSHTWPRAVDEYAEMFAKAELLEVQKRDIEPSYGSHAGNVMLFALDS